MKRDKNRSCIRKKRHSSKIVSSIREEVEKMKGITTSGCSETNCSNYCSDYDDTDH